MSAGALGAAAIGAAGNIIGSAITGSQAASAASRAAGKAKNLYQRRYQITMRDMRRAGLNPILAYQGIGGQPPNVAQAQVPNYLQGVVASAVGAGRAKGEIDLLKSQDEKASAEAGAAQSRDMLNVELINLTRRQTEREAASAKQIKVDTAATLTRLPGMMSREALDKTRYGRFLRWIDMTSKSLMGKGGSGEMR